MALNTVRWANIEFTVLSAEILDSKPVYNEGTPTGKPDGKSYLYVHLRARSEALPITQYCSPFALDLPSGSSVDRVAGGCVRLDSGTTTETVAAFTLPIGADR